jgi:hypothetical protein
MNDLFQTPEASAPSIASSAMTVELSMSIWTARKKDHKASDDVANMNAADKGVANVTKNLLGNCDELTALQKFAGNLRNLHYSMTMPWSDNGQRLVTTMQYFKYNEVMTEMIDEGWRMVDDFLNVYEWKVMDAQAKLGAMFNRDEYPTRDAIRDKFAFRLSYEQLPDGGNTGDWRLDLPHEAMQTLRTNYTDTFNRKIKGAMDDVWTRLHTNLTRLVRQLDVDEEGKGNRLYDTVFDQALSLTEMLGTCNVTGDTQMEAMKRQLEQALHYADGAPLTVDSIKKSPSLRENTRAKLDAALSALPSLDM